MVNLLVAAALSVAVPADMAPPPAVSEPAMFIVQDADTTIYIFGTFHALDGGSQWFGDRVRGALGQSQELVLETVIPKQPEFSQPVASIRGPAVTPSASFLATTRMAIKAGRLQGMKVSNGADMVLRDEAEAEGKAVDGLETFDSQINMFNRMPSDKKAPGSPSNTKSSMDMLSTAMAEMQAAWKSGNQDVFVRMLGQLRSTSPDVYRMMFTERNARWADWIRARMQAPGTVFVAVGAGHLAGSDSLLVRLAERGLPSRRVY